jgi:hypothetical protein
MDFLPRRQVRGQGIGIPEADQDWLFNAFHRGQNVADRPVTGLSSREALRRFARRQNQIGESYRSIPVQKRCRCFPMITELASRKWWTLLTFFSGSLTQEFNLWCIGAIVDRRCFIVNGTKDPARASRPCLPGSAFRVAGLLIKMVPVLSLLPGLTADDCHGLRARHPRRH